MTSEKHKEKMNIRLLQETDLPTRVEWMNDPRIYSSMHYSVPVIMERTIEWYKSIITNEKRSDVVFTNSSEIVAFGGLTSITDKPRIAELYVFVNPSSQQKGIGTAATSLLCKWGFTELTLSKIYLYTNEDNHAAIRVYQKCGFTLEGRLRQEYLNVNGVCLDRLYYGLLKSEWDVNNGK